MENPLKRIASKFGIYLGGVLSLLILLGYCINIDLFVTFWFGLALYGISIIFGMASTFKVKQYFKSFISFRESFSAYFICILIGLAIYTLVTFVLFNYVDFEASKYLNEKSIAIRVEVMKQTKIPEATISKTMESFKNQNLYAFGNVIKSLLFAYLLPLSVIGLLIAAVTKKSNPETE